MLNFYDSKINCSNKRKFYILKKMNVCKGRRYAAFHKNKNRF